MDRMLKNLVIEYEKLANPRLPACSRKSGKLLETCCTIMDLKGVGLTSVSSVYGFVSEVSKISQNYYPERLGKLYIINAPWGFSGVFSVVKKFLDPVTVNGPTIVIILKCLLELTFFSRLTKSTFWVEGTNPSFSSRFPPRTFL